MARTKIFGIKHYKNLIQKMHFIKYLQWHYKGHNLAKLNPISKPRNHCAPYHVRSTKITKLFLYSKVFIHYERLFTNVQKQQLFKHFKKINSSFSVIITIIFLKKPVYHQNRHFMLTLMVFVPTLYIKASVSYDCIIKSV